MGYDSYNLHNFVGNTRLYASQLNEMDKGIIDSHNAMYADFDVQYTAVDLEITDGSFRLHTYGGVFDWAFAKRSNKFPVTAGETLYVDATGWKYNDASLQVAAILFFSGESGGTYLGYDLLPTSGQKKYEKQPVVVPNNATYAVVQGASTAVVSCSRAHSFIDDLITITTAMESGHYWHPTNGYKAWANATVSNSFPVTVGESLFVTAKAYGGAGNVPGIVFFSTETPTSASDMIGYDLLPAETTQTQYTNSEVIVPDGAVSACIQGVSDGTYLAKRQNLAIIWSNTFRLNEKIKDLKPISAKLSLSGTIYAVVDDTIQLFYESFIDSDVPVDSLIVKFQCTKGKDYPRYWEFTPTASDVGTHAITVELYNMSGNLLDSTDVELKVITATNPASTKNVLFIGDSLMQGEIPIETSRRFKGTAGATSTPAALALNNINVVGRIRNSAETVGWEGTGGWRYSNYTSSGVPAIRFTVTGATDVVVGAYYSVGDYTLNISEVNVTNGSGNIRCLIIGASSIGSTPQSGSLTKKTGSSGQNSITFTAWSAENYQPFWDSANNKFDIASYVNTYCNGQLDIVCILLGINGVSTLDTFADVSTIVTEGKTLFSLIHADLPNAKIIVSTMPMPSPLGGLGANNSASANNGMYNYHGYCHKVKEYNKLLLALNDDDNFNSYVRVVNVHSQFDAYHGYPVGTKAVNTRVSTTETVQTNGVHPRNEGYWQLADALGFRSILGILAEN